MPKQLELEKKRSQEQQQLPSPTDEIRSTVPLSLHDIILLQSEDFTGELDLFMEILKNYKKNVNIINSDIEKKLEQINELVKGLLSSSSLNRQISRNSDELSSIQLTDNAAVEIIRTKSKETVTKTAMSVTPEKAPVVTVRVATKSDSVVRCMATSKTRTSSIDLTDSSIDERIIQQNIGRLRPANQPIPRRINLNYVKYLNDAQNLLRNRIYGNIRDEIVDRLKKIGRTTQALEMGSIAYGLGNETSLLDFYIVTKPMFDEKLQDVSIKIGEGFKVGPFTVMGYVPNPRASHLIVSHKSTGQKCKIFMGSDMLLEQTILLRQLFALQPIAYALSAVIKQWAMDSPNIEGISTYALMLMVIFYLQSLRLIPPIDLLNIKRKETVHLGGYFPTMWHIDSVNKSKINDGTVFAHFIGFLQFYLNFDYTNMVICPLIGKPIAKTNLFNCTNTGDGLKRLAEYIKQPAVRIQNRTNDLIQMAMAIQCPVDLLSIFGCTGNQLNLFLATFSNKLKSMDGLSTS